MCEQQPNGAGTSQDALTALLARWRDGDQDAGEAVAPLVYAELRRIARRLFRGERQGHTLQATAVVHEAFVELIERRGVPWHDRSQFYGFAAHLMRRVLIRHSRRRGAAKRGGGQARLTLDETQWIVPGRAPDLEAVDSAIEALAARDPTKAKLVELRVFGGLTIQEAARFLGCSTSTVNRQWRLAVAFLHRELAPSASETTADD